MHWQPMYDELKRTMVEIEWGYTLSTAETFETYTEFLVILNDMMDDDTNDSDIMEIFTEHS